MPEMRALYEDSGRHGDQLRTLAGLVDGGKLRPHVQRIYPLAQAAEAHKQSQAGHVRGKLVLAL